MVVIKRNKAIGDLRNRHCGAQFFRRECTGCRLNLQLIRSKPCASTCMKAAVSAPSAAK